jgi:hypothetical protein
VVPFICAILAVILLTACHSLPDNKKECDSLHVDYLLSPGETADRYTKTPDGKLIFSKNDSDNYLLRVYENDSVYNILPDEENVFNPFLLSGEISGLQDFEGNEEFVPLNNLLKEFTTRQSVRNIFPVPEGNRLILEMKDESALLLFDPDSQEGKTIFSGFEKLNGLSFNDDFVVISSDNDLNLYEFNSGRTFPLADRMSGEKLNPYISGNKIYFVNNDFSEHFSAYSIDMSNTSGTGPEEVYKTQNDIRMPKVKGGFLYYIEIIRSEYLLKRINLNSLETESLTKEGVVYNYDFFNDTLISFVYSDLNTPKNLFLCNTENIKMVNVSGSSTEHNINASFISDSGSLSCAWLLSDTLKTMEGIILFIHPGLHSDFSPRWDNLLMDICANGYYILAPNYPMSCGYGKTFTGMSESDAVHDLGLWKKYIRKKYRDKPVYCISASSSNILMEQLLDDDFSGITAAVSLFGVPWNENNFKKKVPVLYILGENDPVINFSSRYFQLTGTYGINDSDIISYPDEGHWFRKKKNLEDAVDRILKYLCNH